MNLGIGGRIFAILIGLHVIAVWVLARYDGRPREGVGSVGAYAMARPGQ